MVTTGVDVGDMFLMDFNDSLEDMDEDSSNTTTSQNVVLSASNDDTSTTKNTTINNNANANNSPSSQQHKPTSSASKTLGNHSTNLSHSQTMWLDNSTQVDDIHNHQQAKQNTSPNQNQNHNPLLPSPDPKQARLLTAPGDTINFGAKALPASTSSSSSSSSQLKSPAPTTATFDANSMPILGSASSLLLSSPPLTSSYYNNLNSTNDNIQINRHNKRLHQKQVQQQHPIPAPTPAPAPTHASSGNGRYQASLQQQLRSSAIDVTSTTAPASDKLFGFSSNNKSLLHRQLLNFGRSPMSSASSSSTASSSSSTTSSSQNHHNHYHQYHPHKHEHQRQHQNFYGHQHLVGNGTVETDLDLLGTANGGSQNYIINESYLLDDESASSEDSLSEDEYTAIRENPTKILETIEALARSVHDDNEVFGSLPRRHFNTGELVRSLRLV